MTPKSLQLFEELLIGHQLTTAEIDDLIANQVREDLYIEYKHGKELTKRDASDTIREYTSGFANSLGGTLIIGIDAPQGVPLQITGCYGHNKGDLGEWAARCLTPISHYFSPPPRVQVVSHPNGDVLILAAQRSPGLIPRLETGKIVYHFRFHDQTLKAPEYLVADLLLGRRQQPSFDIEDFRAINLKRVLENADAAMDLEIELRWRFENKSIVWAEDCRWGLIAWVKQTDNRYQLEIGQPSNHLLSHIEVRDLQSNRYTKSRQLLHFRSIANSPYAVRGGLL